MPHRQTLLSRHAELEEEISREMAHPGWNDSVVSRMKREKLAIKDQLDRLEKC